MISQQEQQRLQKRIKHNENHLQTLRDTMTTNSEQQNRLANEHYRLTAQINQSSDVISNLRSELMECWEAQL